MIDFETLMEFSSINSKIFHLIGKYQSSEFDLIVLDLLDINKEFDTLIEKNHPLYRKFYDNDPSKDQKAS